MTSRDYAPPWYDSETGEYYGPKTEATYAKHIANAKNWAYKKQGPERPEAPLVHRYFFHCHADLQPWVVRTYRAVYVHQLGTKKAAEYDGVSVSTVKKAVRILKQLSKEWECQLDTTPEIGQK